MWQIIKSELNYSWWISALYIILTPALFLYLYTEKDAPPFLVFLLMFIIAQNYVAFRNKEKRERLFAQLPVAFSRIALSRIFIILSFFFNIALIYLIFASLTDAGAADYLFPLITSICILSIMFGAYFILRDVFLQKFRDRGVRKERMKIFLVLLILAINVLLVLSFIQARNNDTPSVLVSIIRFIENNLPFTWQNGLWEALALTVVICGLSILSFLRRKAYME